MFPLKKGLDNIVECDQDAEQQTIIGQLNDTSMGSTDE